MEVYLDNSATTRPFDEVTDIVVRYMKEDYGNPSSLHHMGLVAEKALKKARNQIADAACCDPENVTFTSGGTEADDLAIIGSAHSIRQFCRHLKSWKKKGMKLFILMLTVKAVF